MISVYLLLDTRFFFFFDVKFQYHFDLQYFVIIELCHPMQRYKFESNSQP